MNDTQPSISNAEHTQPAYQYSSIPESHFNHSTYGPPVTTQPQNNQTTCIPQFTSTTNMELMNASTPYGTVI